MALDSKYFDIAEAEIKELHARNISIVEERERALSAQYPEINDLRGRLAGTMSRLFSMISENKGSGSIGERLDTLKEENLGLQAQLKAALVKHGYPEDYLDPIYSCPVCKDTGLVDGKCCTCYLEKARRAASDEMNRSTQLRLHSFEEFSLDYYDDTIPVPNVGASARKIMAKNLSACKEYAANFTVPYSSLLLRGKTGLGKTHLSLAIAKEVLEKGYSVIYGSTPELFRRIEKESFNRAKASEDTLEKLINTDLLVLDDVGAEVGSKFYPSWMYDIINSRLNASRPIVISTNMENTELQERYGERTCSRMLTMRALLFFGSDVRVKLKNTR